MVAGFVIFVSILNPSERKPPKKIATQTFQPPSDQAQRATKDFHIKGCLSVKHDDTWIRLPKPKTDEDPFVIGGIRSLAQVKFSCPNSKYVEDYTKELKSKLARQDLAPMPFLINGQEGRTVEYMSGGDKHGVFYVQSKKRVCVAEMWASEDAYNKNVAEVQAAVATLQCE